MSPRAAWRLERLGFEPVYDYVAGKVDWMAAGLATIRAEPSHRRAIDAIDTTPVTCAPDTPVRDLPDRRAPHDQTRTSHELLHQSAHDDR